MRKVTSALLATLVLAAPLGVAQAAGVAISIATPHFGLQLGAPIYAPPVYASPVYLPVVVPPRFYAPPVRVVVPPPRYVAMPAPVYPVAYRHVLRPGKHKHHKHAGPAYRGMVPVVAVPYHR